MKKTQEQQKAELQSLTAQLESYKAECERRGEINEVHIDQSTREFPFTTLKKDT